MTTQTLIGRWADAQKLPLQSAPAGRLTLVIDGRYRLHLMPAPYGRIAAEARICDLPAVAGRREEMIRKAMCLATGRMHSDRAILAVDAAGAALLLQDSIAEAEGVRALSDLVGRIANSVSFWRAALDR